jgi:hypothetical protein
MAGLLQEREPVVEVPPTGRPRRPRRHRGVRLAAAAAGLAVAVVAGERVVDWAGQHLDPTQPQVVDRSTPPLLVALADLHEYHAATGTFQVVVDQERDVRYVPSVLAGERTQLLATGTVDASVDFTDVGPDRVQLSADRRSVTIDLPAPTLGAAHVDPANSRVLDRDRGLLERVGDAVGDRTTDDGPLYALAEQRIAAAATGSDLLDRGERSTRDMLTSLAHSMGVEQVTVTFDGRP